MFNKKIITCITICFVIFSKFITGSGKTFTTVGEQGGQQPGIVPQAIHYVVGNIQQQNVQHPG